MKTEELDGNIIIEEWDYIVAGSGFAPKCPKGCKSTGGDFNLHTELEIYELGNFSGQRATQDMNWRESKKIKFEDVRRNQ
jgi:hypothetical protein